MKLGDIFQELLRKVEPDENYLEKGSFNHDVLIEPVRHCLNIDDPKTFRTCISKSLDSEYRQFESVLLKCHDEYRKHRNFDMFVTCIRNELENRGSRILRLVDYCSISVRNRRPSDLHDCVYSALEAISEVTKRAVREYGKHRTT